MSWYLILYIFSAIVIGTWPTVTLFQGGRSIAAIIYVVLILLVLIFFGLRWFWYGGGDDSSVQWPPVINACPDYLTFFNRPSSTAASGTTPSCIDLVGVSRNGALAKWRPEFSTENPPTDDKYFFSLATTSTNATARNQELCSNAIAAGLSWEGVTNGESCYASTGSPINGGGAVCGGAQQSLLKPGPPTPTIPKCDPT